MNLKDLFRAEVVLRRSGDDGNDTHVSVFNVDDLKNYYSYYESSEKLQRAVEKGRTTSAVYFMNAEDCYDGEDFLDTVEEIKAKIKSAENERVQRIMNSRISSDLCDLFRAEVTLTRSGDEGEGVYSRVFNVNDIKRYYSHYTTQEKLAKAVENKDTTSTIYFVEDGDSYDCCDVLETVPEIQEKIRIAENERVERIQQCRLGIS